MDLRLSALSVVCVFSCVFLCLTDAYRPLVRKLSKTETEHFETRASISPRVFSSILDNDGMYLLVWQYDNDSITFNVTVEATGWVGLGFSPKGGMVGADIAIVWFDADGLPHISDRHARRNEYPLKDSHQDYTLLSASRNETHITASFRRLRDTCDDAEDYQLKSDNTRIIYAFSNKSISPETDLVDDLNMEQHAPKNRGTKGLFLFEPPELRQTLPEDTIVVDLLAANVHVPFDYHLTYWCQMFEMPQLPVHHLIRLEPIVQKGHERLVHHLAIYQCASNMSAYLDKGERCFIGDGNNLTNMYQCTSKIMWFWNVGMKASDLPDNVGFPLLERAEDGYILLEIHYENPELRSDLYDHSGIRMFLTPTLRPVEAGLMVYAALEQPPFHILPPGDPEFRFYVHGDNCMKFIPPQGITLYNVLLHAHTHGKRTRVHHYRNGIQLPDISVDDNYDFYYENFRLLEPPLRVFPDDELVLECVYDTSKDNKTVFGGFSTTNEMCGMTYFYYPRISRGFVCFGYPDPQEYVPMFGGQLQFDNQTVLLPSNQNVTLYDFVTQHLDWNKPGIRDEYKEFIRNGQYVQKLQIDLVNQNQTHKTSGAGNWFSGDDSVHMMYRKGYPKVTHPWTQPIETRQCHQSSRVGGYNKTDTILPVITDAQSQSSGCPSLTGHLCFLLVFMVKVLVAH